MSGGIFHDFEQVKSNTPGWTRRLPKAIRNWVVKAYWLRNDLRDFTAEMVGFVPSHNLRLVFYRWLGVRIGKKTSLHRGCRMYAPSGVRIGEHTTINREVLLDGRAGLDIGSNVSISEGAAIFSLEHDPNDDRFTARGAKVFIEDYVFIGARAMLLPGVNIRRGAVVAAGAVVTKDVEAYQIVGGVPARPIGQRNQDLNYQIDYRKFLG